MLPSFLIINGHLTSDFADTHALHVGDRLSVSRPLDIGYMAQIEEGEMGTVVDIEPTQGGAEVLLDTLHRGLCAWGNCLLLIPFMTDDTLDAFRLVTA